MTEPKKSLTLLGCGNTAEVFAWGEGRVLKLFVPGYPEDAARKEYTLSRRMDETDVPHPRSHGFLEHEGRFGIVYDRVDGTPLTDWVLQTGDLADCTTRMAALHRQLARFPGEGLPDYRDFLRWGMEQAWHGAIPADALALLAALPEGSALCHGDFHPGNLIVHGGDTVVIDFMNLCRGPWLYDVARAVFLVEETPLPSGVPDPVAFQQMRRSLTTAYLALLPMEREALEPFLTVIRLARRGECPNEG